MAVLSNLLSPLSVAFIVIVLGYYIGKIKFAKISLDLSGVLIVAVLTGWMLSAVASCSSMVNVIEYEANMKFFSSFGTALFVSSIGIATGSTLDFQKWKDIKAIFIGSSMVASTFVIMKIVSLIDDNISISKLLGALCGALTTTPGLTAACELKNIIPEEVALGYGCTYLFGVVATVLFVQMATRKTDYGNNANTEKSVDHEEAADLNGLIQIGCTIIMGRLLGSINIFGFSLGNSGGILCCGIIIGLFLKKISFPKLLTNKNLSLFKNLGLVLFFVGNGIPAGMQICGEFDIKIILYGTLMTLIPIMVGVILQKLFFYEESLATIIAGGMTSTPAIGVLAQKHRNISLSAYATAYFGALLTAVLMIRYSV